MFLTPVRQTPTEDTRTRRIEAADLEAILPKNADYGHDWTFSDFMIALTFFGEGLHVGAVR